MDFTWKYFWVVLGIFFLPSFSIRPFIFPSIFSTWAPACGSKLLQQVPWLLVNTSVALPKHLLMSQEKWQSWFLVAGFALNFLASSKKRVRSHCWMLFLSGEAAELRVTRRVIGHKASWHLFMESVCTGEGRAVGSQGLARLGWRKGIANVPASLFPTRLARRAHSHRINSMGVWVSERTQRKATVGSGTAEVVTVTRQSTLSEYLSVKVGPSRPGWQLKGQDQESGTYLSHTRIWRAGLLWVTRHHL